MLEGSPIASSETTLPQSGLSGYAMVGSDIVFEGAGQTLFGDVLPGQDGAYVSIQRSGRTATIGTDSAGYGRLFLYEDRERWALDASLMALADWVQSEGWQLELDPEHLQGFLLEGTVGRQLVSNRTIFRQIRVVPADTSVVVRAGVRGNRFQCVTQAPTPPYRSYAGLLQQAIEETTGRIRTLIEHEVPLVADITGGRSSRAVLGLLLAGNDTSHSIADAVRFRSDRGREKDLIVSEALSATYGLRVNERTAEREEYVDPDYEFALWRRHDLGVYGPIYSMRSFTHELPISGVGGESHRVFYSAESMDEVVDLATPAAMSQRTALALKKAMNLDLDVLANAAGDRRVVHYRAFRDRFHGGRNPLKQMTIAPLASGSLRRASTLMPQSRRKRSQVLVDVLVNTHESLIHDAYDTSRKSVTKKQINEATRIMRRDPVPGRVYGAMHVPDTVERKSRSLAAFESALVAAADRVRGRGLLPDGLVDAAALAMNDARERDRFMNVGDGQLVSTVILAGDALRLTDPRHP